MSELCLATGTLVRMCTCACHIDGVCEKTKFHAAAWTTWPSGFTLISKSPKHKHSRFLGKWWSKQGMHPPSLRVKN